MSRATEYAVDSRNADQSENAEPRLLRLDENDWGGDLLPFGIGPVDRRFGGLEAGGVYLISGTPGPAKLVAALHFLKAGIENGERSLFLTEIEPSGLLEVAQAWGVALDDAWNGGRLEVVGFRDDFEMRVLRSAEPNDALEELRSLVPADVTRIAVDPGSMFIQPGGRSLLAKSFLEWARNHPATVCVTLSLDSPETLPSSAEWLIRATTGVFLIDPLPDGLFQVVSRRSLPPSDGRDDPVTLQLLAGQGFTAPDQLPARRFSDRPLGDPDRVLLVCLGRSGPSELEVWAENSFRTETVAEPLEAVARLQGGPSFGCVLVQAPRQRLREAVQACRAMRPLTAAPFIVTSDDAIRSTDHVNLLEAGADDCLSGGVDFRELAARIRQASAAGGKFVSPAEAMKPIPAPPPGGSVDPGEFRHELEKRASDPRRSVFGLIRLEVPSLSPSDLGSALSGEIRVEEGDLVTRIQDGCLVLLQGARSGPAQAFLARFTSRLTEKFGRDLGLRARVMTHPSERDEILTVAGRLKGPEVRPAASFDLGGPGGEER